MYTRGTLSTRRMGATLLYRVTLEDDILLLRRRSTFGVAVSLSRAAAATFG